MALAVQCRSDLGQLDIKEDGTDILGPERALGDKQPVEIGKFLSKATDSLAGAVQASAINLIVETLDDSDGLILGHGLSPVPAAAVSFERANTTAPRSVATGVDVGLNPRMTRPASHPQNSSEPAAGILLIGDGFKVARPITRRDTAEMVEMESWRNRPVGVLVSDTMNQMHSPVIVDFAVSTADLAALPEPARLGFESSSPDALDERATKAPKDGSLKRLTLPTANVMGIAEAASVLRTPASLNRTQAFHGLSVMYRKDGV